MPIKSEYLGIGAQSRYFLNRSRLENHSSVTVSKTHLKIRQAWQPMASGAPTGPGSAFPGEAQGAGEATHPPGESYYQVRKQRGRGGPAPRLEDCPGVSCSVKHAHQMPSCALLGDPNRSKCLCGAESGQRVPLRALLTTAQTFVGPPSQRTLRQR